MLTYAMVVETATGSMSPAVLSTLRDATLDEVPFAPLRHCVWFDEARSLCFAGWQSTGDGDPVGSRWHADDDAITAFTGHVWPRTGPWPTGRTWAAGLSAHLGRRSLAHGTDDLLGVFTALRIDRSGSGTLASDPLGLGVTYWSQHRDITVFSSRASVVAAVVSAANGGARPPRDVLATGVLAHGGRWLGNRTGYEGIEALPAGATVVLQSGRDPRVREPRRRYWRFEAPRRLHPEEMLRELRSDMASSLQACLSLSAPRRVLNLTGGRDSRMILAGVLDLGLQSELEYLTWGADDLPDVIIARELADAVGVPLGVNVPVKAGVAWRRHRAAALEAAGERRDGDRHVGFRLAVGATLGMWNVYQPNIACPPHSDRITLSGLTGELLRTNFPGSDRLRTLNDISTFLFDGLDFGRAGILRAEVREHYDQQAWSSAFVDLHDGDRPQDVVDGFFLRDWLRWWFAYEREVDEQHRLFPLCSPFAVRSAFEMGVAARRSEWFHQQVIRTSSSRLADVPFAKDPWPTLCAPSPARRWPRRRSHPLPLPARPPSGPPRPFASSASARQRTVVKDQRDASAATDLEIMRRHLLEDTGNPVWELLDPVGVRTALDGFAELAERTKSQLYGALSAAIWLGGHELSYRAGGDGVPTEVGPLR